MASNTPNLNLYKKDPTIDGNDTFNIKTMLNDNWDKIDAAVTAKVDKVNFSSHLADNTAHNIGTATLGTTAQTIKGAINEVLGDVNTHLTDSTYQTATGTATAITITTATLVDGYAKTFIASANNSGSATTINGKPLYKPNTTTAPNLIAGKAYTVWYNSTGDSGNGCFFIKASAEGNTIVSHVLAGETFSNDTDTGLVGTAPLKSGITYTPTTSDQTITAGLEDGTCKVKGDANLVTANIKLGVSIFGINGKSSVIDTASATATAANILSGKTAGINGVMTSGTMPNLSGNWQTAQYKGNYNGGASGYAVLAQIPQGYSDGGTNTYTACYDTNFVPTNIISGKSIFGLAGTATPRFATINNPTVTGTTSGSFYAYGSWTTCYCTVDITSLDFTPIKAYAKVSVGGGGNDSNSNFNGTGICSDTDTFISAGYSRSINVTFTPSFRSNGGTLTFSWQYGCSGSGTTYGNISIQSVTFIG